MQSLQKSPIPPPGNECTGTPIPGDEEDIGRQRLDAEPKVAEQKSLSTKHDLIVEEVFDDVAVATGHSQPRLPAIKGMDMWSGRQMHSHVYRVPEPFRNECYGSVAENTQLWCILEDLCHGSVAENTQLWCVLEDLCYGSVAENTQLCAMVPWLRILSCGVFSKTWYSYSLPFLDTKGIVKMDDGT
ncbi:hypothetical protein LguiB_013336 [Lonicera macranthoides]